MKKLSILTLLFLLLAATSHAARQNHEKHYQDLWCEGKGETEFVLPGKARVDCLTDNHAVEVDFADKWAESIGQSLYYAEITGKKPGVLLIMEDPDKDRIFWLRLMVVARQYGIDVWTIKP